MLIPPILRLISRTRFLNRSIAFGAIRRLLLSQLVKLNREKLPLMRFGHRAFRLIYLELQPLADELLYALHHPLPRPLASNVDITVVRIARESVAPSLQRSPTRTLADSNARRLQRSPTRSRSNSSSTRLLSCGESGPPCR